MAVRLKNYFQFKDVIPKSYSLAFFIVFGVVAATPSIMTNLNARAAEHLDISHCTGKVIKTKDSAIVIHFKTSPNCNSTFDDFDIILGAKMIFYYYSKKAFLLNRTSLV